MSQASAGKQLKFGQIARKKSARIGDPKHSKYDRYVGLEHLESGELVVRKWGSTKDVSSGMQLFKRNDILFSRRNTYLKRVSVALFDGVCSGDIIVLEPILEHIVEGFLPIFMQYEEFQNRVVSWSAGAFSKRIKWDQLADLEIWIPSKEEQLRMVEVVWSIHSHQEKIEHLGNTTNRLKRGLLEELLTKGIRHNSFKNTELGPVPETWNIVELGSILTETKYGLSAKLKDEGEYPVIKMDDLVDGTVSFEGGKFVDLDDDEARRYRLEFGDVLFNRTNSIEHVGRTGTFKLAGSYLFASYLILLRPNKKMVLSDYLTYYLNHFNDKVKTLATPAIQQVNINASNLRQLKLAIPPVEEQEKICLVVATVMKQIKILDEMAIAVKNLKVRIINQLLSKGPSLHLVKS